MVYPSYVDEDAKEKLAPYLALSGDESYSNRDLENMSQQVAKCLYTEKVQPTTLLPKQVGNMYTASLYAAFASLIHEKNIATLVAELIGFQSCMHSCLEYLEAIPWVGDEEEEKVLLWLL
ncbi:hypothetical protein Scep_017170 [Stephania cephalantha]|uniref:Hydroxymethylglutaryl-coenzyme A synthase C-terminal domain-containing protein n=1 Tax=Stephania cephalantha TaxID=152367 RepID=A0AAP0NTB4_9MAGN